MKFLMFFIMLTLASKAMALSAWDLEVIDAYSSGETEFASAVEAHLHNNTFQDDRYCDELSGVEDLSANAVSCILWGEMSLLHSELPLDPKGHACSQDSQNPVNPAFTKTCHQTAKVALCRREFAPHRLNTDEIACRCPSQMSVPAPAPATRQWERIQSCAQDTVRLFNQLARDEKELFCRDFFFFYHKSPRIQKPKDWTGYMTEELYQKALQQDQKNKPPMHEISAPQRVIPIRKLPARTCEKWETIFPIGVDDRAFEI